MKLFKVTRVSFANTLSIVLCAAVISSCGSSKDSKSGTPVIGATPTVAADGTTPATGTAVPQPTNKDPNPADKNKDGAKVAPVDPNAPKPAPIGHSASSGLPSLPGTLPDKKDKKENKNKTPDFKDDKAVLTGGKSGDLNYTSASDDGLMDSFRATSVTVGADQQTLNKKLAAAITGARLKKVDGDTLLDISTNEFDVAKIYRLKATVDGNKMKLSLAGASTGDLEFQGGFLKCLEDSCESAYAKIKLSGAYTRIIFRTTNMNNNFQIQQNITDANFKLWTSYIFNTVQGAAAVEKITSVRASSYEVLNGRSAMGVQMLTQNNEAFSLSTPLLAPDAGTALTQPAEKYADPSNNYNLAATTGKTFVLSKAVSAVNLVNNNGKGAVRLKLSIDSGSIWMVLSPVAKTTLSVADVKAFEATVPNF